MELDLSKLEDRIEYAGILMNNQILDECPQLANTPCTRGWGELVVDEFKNGIRKYLAGEATDDCVEKYISTLTEGWRNAGAVDKHALDSAVLWFKCGLGYGEQHYEWLMTGLNSE